MFLAPNRTHLKEMASSSNPFFLPSGTNFLDPAALGTNDASALSNEPSRSNPGSQMVPSDFRMNTNGSYPLTSNELTHLSHFPNYPRICSSGEYAADDLGGSMYATESFIDDIGAIREVPMFVDMLAPGFADYDCNQPFGDVPNTSIAPPILPGNQNPRAETGTWSATLTPDTAELFRGSEVVTTQAHQQLTQNSQQSFISTATTNIGSVSSHVPSRRNQTTLVDIPNLALLSSKPPSQSHPTAPTAHQRTAEQRKTKVKSSSGHGTRGFKPPKGTSSFQNAIGMFSATNTPARKSYNQARRQEVAMTRASGACFPCRMWKATVSPLLCEVLEQ